VQLEKREPTRIDRNLRFSKIANITVKEWQTLSIGFTTLTQQKS
jgi:hypothetical protein